MSSIRPNGGQLAFFLSLHSTALRRPNAYYLPRTIHSSFTVRKLSTLPSSLHTPSPASKSLGQPSHETHPHLIGPGELTPGISKDEYHERRRKLMESLPAGAIVVCRAAKLKFMSGQIFYKFRQCSDFWYLTGIEEQHSAVILYRTSDANGYKMHLFMRERDANDELWHGPRTGVSRSREAFGAHEVSSIDEFTRVLRSVTKKESHVYADLRSFGNYTTHNLLGAFAKSFLAHKILPASSATEGTIEDILKKARPASLSECLAKFRRIKSTAERALMKKAGDVSGTAHAKTMRFAKTAKSEAQLAAHFEYMCALEGAQRPAYVPVVASGSNALTIHYTNNDCLLKQDELVLMDAGCELNGYASDITRTFPVGPSGKFSGPQKELYEAVLSVQKNLIPLCTENARQSLNSLHAASIVELSKSLSTIGFDLGAGNRRLDRLYPHFLSHPVGIDLHEPRSQRHQYLSEGEVITVEPGVYIPPDDEFPKWFHNIGIRIEDEVLVEKGFARVLTVNAPKEIVDIEAVCQGVVDVGPY